MMIERVGRNLREFVYQGMASVDVECFLALNRYCQRIESLTLFDVTIDRKLITLLMPVLENLKTLYIDRYLLIKKVRLEGPLNEGEVDAEGDVDVLTDIQCLMLCLCNLKHLSIGEPFDKDSFLSHGYLSTLLDLLTLNLNLARNTGFTEFGEYFGHTFLPLTSLELILPNDGVVDYDKFCLGLENLSHLEALKLNNLQNKHFGLLIPSLRLVRNLKLLHLNCAQGVILSKSVQQQLNRIDNKKLFSVQISSLKNFNFRFLHSLRWWSTLRSFEIHNCEKFNNDDLLAICAKATNKFTSIVVGNCAILPDIVHLLVRISKLRIYNLNFKFYHENHYIFDRFERETMRTIIQYIHVTNFFSK